MPIVTFSDFTLYFIFYSCLGWVLEVLYCSTLEKKLVNRGFLAGPYCPIYGFGSLLVILLIKPFNFSLPVLFIAAVVVTSVLEYFTSWLMEVIFNIRWWDYSHLKFNIKGRVCLLNSVMFGLLGVLMVKFIQPNLSAIIYSIPSGMKRVIASFIIAALIADLITTLNALYKLDDKLKALRNTRILLENYNKEYLWFDKKDLNGSIEKLKAIALKEENEELTQLTLTLEKLLHKDSTGLRLLSSFPKMKHHSFQDSFSVIKESFSQRKQILASHIGERKKPSATAPSSNAETISFATGLNGYKLFWVFFIACIVGYLVETLFCLATRGFIESRQGLLYGPFNQVYGIGAVILVVLLTKLSRRSERWLFLGSAVIGGVFEFACSYIQEKVFGSVSWEYNTEQISIGGRTSLTYMLFWGILGVLFMKEIYPRLSRFIERIPNRKGMILTWLLIIMMTCNIILSAAAVARWSSRSAGNPPQNSFEVYIDNHYDDAFMKEVYPSMVMVE